MFGTLWVLVRHLARWLVCSKPLDHIFYDDKLKSLAKVIDPATLPATFSALIRNIREINVDGRSVVLAQIVEFLGIVDDMDLAHEPLTVVSTFIRDSIYGDDSGPFVEFEVIAMIKRNMEQSGANRKNRCTALIATVDMLRILVGDKAGDENVRTLNGSNRYGLKDGLADGAVEVHMEHLAPLMVAISMANDGEDDNKHLTEVVKVFHMLNHQIWMELRRWNNRDFDLGLIIQMIREKLDNVETLEYALTLLGDDDDMVNTLLSIVLERLKESCNVGASEGNYNIYKCLIILDTAMECQTLGDSDHLGVSVATMIKLVIVELQNVQ